MLSIRSRYIARLCTCRGTNGEFYVMSAFAQWTVGNRGMNRIAWDKSGHHGLFAQAEYAGDRMRAPITMFSHFYECCARIPM